MDPPKEAATPSPRARRRMHQCPHCDEIFVDEASFEAHKLTHAQEGGGDAPAEAPPAAAAPAAPAAETPAPAPTTTRRARSAAATATPAAATPAAASEAPTRAVAAPTDTLADNVETAFQGDGIDGTGLGPMEWEKASERSNPLMGVWRFMEDFAEWVVLGVQKGIGAFGLTMVPAIGVVLRATVLVLLCVVLVASGILLGRRYGPWLMGQKVDDPPLLPPQRVVPVVTDDTKLAAQAVLDFYSAIDRKSYSVAYDALSSDWRKELNFEQFEKGYRDTQAVRCIVKSSKALSEGKVELSVEIEVVEHGSSKKYTGTYVAHRSEGVWKLDSGALK